MEALEKIYIALREAKSAFNYCIQASESHPDKHIDVYAKPCSRFCTCICCCLYDRQDGLSFYEKEMEKLKEEFDKEKEKALASPIGKAFITFETHQMAKTVYDVFNGSSILCFKSRPPKSTFSAEMDDPSNWNIRYAPPPDDMYWTALSGSRKYLLIKYLLVNTALLVIVLFLSTPGKYKCLSAYIQYSICFI